MFMIVQTFTHVSKASHLYHVSNPTEFTLEWFRVDLKTVKFSIILLRLTMRSLGPFDPRT